MPVQNEKAFRQTIKNGIEKNIFLFSGNDDYLKKFYCGKLISLVTDKSTAAFNLHSYDEPQDLDGVFADAEIMPVMAENTCLLIKGYPLFGLNAQKLKELKKNLSAVPESTVIIFYMTASECDISAAKQNGVINIFSEIGTAVVIDHRTRSDTVRLLMSRAKDKGTEISRENAEYLTECVGDDMSVLLNEFVKVCAFSCGQPVTKEMIDKTAVKSVEASVFDISDSIFSGSTEKALSAMNAVLKQKIAVQAVIGALSNSYVNLYRYKTALNAGKTISDFAEKFQYRETKYQFKKIAAVSKKISMEAVRKSIDILSEADIKSKSTQTDAAVLLTETISKLALACRE